MVGSEKESPLLFGPAGVFLLICHLGAKLDAAAQDTTDLGPTEGVEIGAGVRLARVSTKWATILVLLVSREVVAEIVISLLVSSELFVVFCRCKVDRGTFLRLVSAFARKHSKVDVPYRSSSVRRVEHREAHCLCCDLALRGLDWPSKIR